MKQVVRTSGHAIKCGSRMKSWTMPQPSRGQDRTKEQRSWNDRQSARCRHCLNLQAYSSAQLPTSSLERSLQSRLGATSGAANLKSRGPHQQSSLGHHATHQVTKPILTDKKTRYMRQDPYERASRLESRITPCNAPRYQSSNHSEHIKTHPDNLRSFKETLNRNPHLAGPSSINALTR